MSTNELTEHDLDIILDNEKYETGGVTFETARQMVAEIRRLRTQPIPNEIRRERERQDAKWGGPAHDDEKRMAHFTSAIQAYAVWKMSECVPVCCDCQLPYTHPAWAEVVIPNDIWLEISPTGDEGGLLCYNCLDKRLYAKGYGKENPKVEINYISNLAVDLTSKLSKSQTKDIPMPLRNLQIMEVFNKLDAVAMDREDELELMRLNWKREKWNLRDARILMRLGKKYEVLK